MNETSRKTAASLARRPWVPAGCEDLVQHLASEAASRDVNAQEAELHRLVDWNRDIHEAACVNLNPATNVMNPKAEALLAANIGSRPSLGYPGDKYEMGLEAIERIEVMAAELAAEVFNARHAEIRLASGAMANLYAFMATCTPGDAIIVPPATVAGHVTHHREGAAGLYGLAIHPAPVDADGYTIDVEGLRTLAHEVRPKLITIGTSLNLFPHPLSDIRAVADEVGCHVLFDAAHASGMIAGGAWQQPLAEGCDMMSMSTYKSLGGPAGGLLLTNDAALAEKIDRIAFPGLTANFDAAKSAALAMTLLDWQAFGADYARTMGQTAKALAAALAEQGVEVFAASRGFTTSHQFAVDARQLGGGQAAAKLLRRANVLACGIGLPLSAVDGDVNGLRLGTPEIVRRGMTPADMPQLAALISSVLLGRREPEAAAPEVTAFRQRFPALRFVR